jgi:hypothetical protein
LSLGGGYTRPVRIHGTRRSIMSEYQVNTMAKDVECSMCLNAFFELVERTGGMETGVTGNDRIWQFNGCNHLYHQGCITGWWQKQNGSCPLCNQVKAPNGWGDLTDVTAAVFTNYWQYVDKSGWDNDDLEFSDGSNDQ